MGLRANATTLKLISGQKAGGLRCRVRLTCGVLGVVGLIHDQTERPFATLQSLRGPVRDPTLRQLFVVADCQRLIRGRNLWEIFVHQKRWQ